jgi:predicted transcriptional regulator
MLVKNWMSANVVTVDVDDTMDHALNLMREKNIRLLVIIQRYLRIYYQLIGKFRQSTTEQELQSVA